MNSIADLYDSLLMSLQLGNLERYCDFNLFSSEWVMRCEGEDDSKRICSIKNESLCLMSTSELQHRIEFLETSTHCCNACTFLTSLKGEKGDMDM